MLSQEWGVLGPAERVGCPRQLALPCGVSREDKALCRIRTSTATCLFPKCTVMAKDVQRPPSHREASHGGA